MDASERNIKDMRGDNAARTQTNHLKEPATLKDLLRHDRAEV